MISEIGLRRLARVCAQLAPDCDDRHLAELFTTMAADLANKADELEALEALPRNTNRIELPHADWLQRSHIICSQGALP